MTEREIMNKKLSAYQFMVQDLKLYLDTHPMDAETVKKLEEYTEKASKLKKEFEEKFGPLTSSQNNSNRWKWIKAPWPWETEEDCD